jgi:hypothetical protein
METNDETKTESGRQTTAKKKTAPRLPGRRTVEGKCMESNHTLPPRNMAAEPLQFIEERLACVLMLSDKHRRDVLRTFDPNDVSCPSVAKVVAATARLHEAGKPIDFGLVMMEMMRTGDYDPQVFVNIVGSQGVAENASEYAWHVQQAAYVRAAEHAGHQIAAFAHGSQDAALVAQQVADRLRMLDGRRVDTRFGAASWDDACERAGFYTPEELMVAYPQDAEPVIHGLFRRGEVVTVTSWSGAGKSWNAAQMALSIATGRPYLGHETNQGRVLVLDMELRGPTLKNRVEMLCQHVFRGESITTELRFCPIRSERPKNLMVAVERKLAEFHEEHNIAAIILDPVYRLFADQDDADENDNSMATRFMRKLEGHAERLNAALIGVCHTGKGGSTSEADTVDMAVGAGAFGRTADTRAVLCGHPAESCFVLEAIPRSFPPFKAVTVEKIQLEQGGQWFERRDDITAERRRKNQKQVPLADYLAASDKKASGKAAEPKRTALKPEAVAEFILGQPGQKVIKTRAAGLVAEKFGVSQAAARAALDAAAANGHLDEPWQEGPRRVAFVGMRQQAALTVG